MARGTGPGLSGPEPQDTAPTALLSAPMRPDDSVLGLGRAYVAASPPAFISLARFDSPDDPDLSDDNTGSIPRTSDTAEAAMVNRTGKGDLLIPRLQLDILNEALRQPVPADQSADDTDDLEAAANYEPFPEYDVSLSLELHPRAPVEGLDDPVDSLDMEVMFGGARVYFDPAPIGVKLASIEPFPAGEAPFLTVPTTVANAPDTERETEAPNTEAETATPRTGPGKADVAAALRQLTPANRLKLEGKARARAERCLANAVYFEARGESVRGQIAVAQVVLNRTFSGFYPRDICGVVYQGAHRHLSCQFTFACDGIPDVVTEPAAWARANRIANATLDGKVWLADVGKATHYHAYWVHPSWTRSMRRLQKIGVHSFYRPRRWGDGADAPSWGTASASALAAKL
jgi:spore germination cell wall hydrolase CwlJ-like protein